MLGLLCICVAYSPGGGCRGGVIGHSSVVTACSLYAGFVVYVCICVACSAGGGCRECVIGHSSVVTVCWVCCVWLYLCGLLCRRWLQWGVIGHSSVVTACSLYAGFVVYVCICVACSPGGGCRGGVIGHSSVVTVC